MLIFKRKIECPNCKTKEWIHALTTHNPQKLEVRMVCHKCRFGKSLPLTVAPGMPLPAVKDCLENIADDFHIDLQAECLELSELEGSRSQVRH